MKTRLAVIAISALAVLPTETMAQPAPARQTSGESGVYVWLDGLYEYIKLPAYGPGLRGTSVPFNLDIGTRHNHDASADGAGFRGAIGVAIPGTRARIEFGGNYLSAAGSQTQFIPAGRGPGVAFVLLTGAGYDNSFACGASFTCTTSSALKTGYHSWQLNGKVAADWTFGSVTITPSLAVFGGSSRVEQTLGQDFSQFFNGATFNTATYAATTSLVWRDVGARAGLNLSTAVAPAFAIDLGGWLGATDRRVSMTGSDLARSSLSLFNGQSTLSLGDNRSVLLANAEAGFRYHFTNGVMLRGFAGLNYDGAVPGVMGPSYGGDITAPTSRSPASIYYASQTSYYAGGGLSWTFGGNTR